MEAGYLALVNAQDEVEGSAYSVMSHEHEDALRTYETGMYEVVRCSIVFEGRKGDEL